MMNKNKVKARDYFWWEHHTGPYNFNLIRMVDGPCDKKGNCKPDTYTSEWYVNKKGHSYRFEGEEAEEEALKLLKKDKSIVSIHIWSVKEERYAFGVH